MPITIVNILVQIDEDVRMISSEAPLLFAKAAQIFITEVSSSSRLYYNIED